MEDKIKLDLATGDCYRTTKYLYTLGSKDFDKIREEAAKVSKKELPPKVKTKF